MSIPSLQSLVLPDGYSPKAVLDANLDTVSILCNDNRAGIDVEIKIFASQSDADTAKRWQRQIETINNGKTNGFYLPFSYQTLPNDKFVAIRKFHSRTVDSLVFFSDTLYKEEKHAICIQIIEICSLLSPNEKYPVFPSRFLIHENLTVQLTDMFPPNPVDEEALRMGWYKSNTKTRDILISHISYIWKIDSNLAKDYLEEYESFIYKRDEKFARKHIPKYVTNYLINSPSKEELPPLLIFDQHRIDLISGNTNSICDSLLNIYYDIDYLTEDMLKTRVVPIIKEMVKNQCELVEALCFFILIKVKKLIKIMKGEELNDTLVTDSMIMSNSPMISSKTSDNHSNLGTIVANGPKDIKLGFTKSLTNIITSEHFASRYIMYSSVTDILSLKKKKFLKDLLLLLISTNNPNEIDIFTYNLVSLIPKLKSRTYTIQVLDRLRITESLLYSLQQINPAFYNPDAIIAKMSSQLFTQTQLKFLISVVKHASPAMLLKFNFSEALSSPSLSTLTHSLFQKIKPLIHSSDYCVLVPQTTPIIPSLQPIPRSDNMLETIEPLIAKQIIGPQKSTFRSSSPVAWTGSPISFNTKSTVDAQFSTDGKFIFTCGSELRMFKLDNVKSHVPNFSSGISKPLVHPSTASVSIHDNFIIGNTNNEILSFMITSQEFSNSYTLPSTINTFARFNESSFLFAGLQDGTVMAGTYDAMGKVFRIPRAHGNIISICSLPQSTQYYIGTDIGSVFMYDLRMQCPIKNIRLSNHKAKISKVDSKSVLITSGPYAAKMDKDLNTIISSYSNSQSYVIDACSMDDNIITAHTNYSVLLWNEQKCYNISDWRSQTLNKGPHYQSSPFNAIPYHDVDITLLRPSISTTSVLSCDRNGKLVIWPVSYSDD